MKHFSLATPGPDEDFMSDSSISLYDGIAFTEAAALRQDLVYSKGSLKAKEKELDKLYKEREAAIESKLQLVTKNKEMEMMLAQAQRGKEKAIEEVKLCKEEVAEMARKLTQAEQRNEADIESKFDLMEKAMIEKAELYKQYAQAQASLLDAKMKMSELEEARASGVAMWKVVFSNKNKECEEGKARIVELEKALEEEKIKNSELEKKWEAESGAFNQLHADINEKFAKKNHCVDEAMTRIADLKNGLDDVAVSISGISRLEEELAATFEAENKIVELDRKEEQNRALEVPVWKNFGSKVVSHSRPTWVSDTLNCAPLKAGILEWKLRVHKLPRSAHMYLGVISSSQNVSLTSAALWFKKTWGCRGDGSAYREGRIQGKKLAPYTNGSIVHFVLDLTEQGTLCVSVNASLPVEVECYMKSAIDKDAGFLPAISCFNETKIELIDFKRR